MKLVRFDAGTRRPHLGVWRENVILDLTRLGETGGLLEHPCWDSMEALLSSGPDGLRRTAEAVEAYLAKAGNTGPEGHFLPGSGTRLLAPVFRPGKVICIGLNYWDHCEESGSPIPDKPVIFAKFSTAISGPGSPIVRPSTTRQLDYEAELGVVIGRTGKNLSWTEAMSYVAGYLNFNDVSARDIQFADQQWVRGKSYDSFAPIGPWLVTADEVPDPGDLSIECRVNGDLRQESSTTQMIFDVPYLVSFVSEAITLLPGDIIATGTPSGVGAFRNPKAFLEPGDVVRVSIEGLGTLENPVVEEEPSAP